MDLIIGMRNCCVKSKDFDLCFCTVLKKYRLKMVKYFHTDFPVLLERDPCVALQLGLDMVPSKVHAEAAMPGPRDFHHNQGSK